MSLSPWGFRPRHATAPRPDWPALLALVALLSAGCTAAQSSPPAAFEPDSVPDPYARPTAALLWPGATRSVHVNPGGHLYTGAWQVRFEPRVGDAPVPPPRVIAYEDRWRPIARWTRRLDGVRWDFEATALPAPADPVAAAARPLRDWLNERTDARTRREIEATIAALPPGSGDDLALHAAKRMESRSPDQEHLLVTLEVRVTNTAPAPREARLGAHLDPADAAQPFHSADRLGYETLVFGWHPHATDTVLAWTELAAGRRDAAGRWSLAPGETRTVRFVVPAYPMRHADLARWARVPHARRVGEARAAWTREVARGARLSLGDPALEQAMRGARVVLLGLRERRDGHWVPLGGPFHYRDVWLRDGSRAVQALALHGYVREARSAVAAFRDWQWPQGPFVSQKAQLDGTGQALWAFDQALMRPAPAPDVAEYAEAARRAWAWCERQRARHAGKEPGFEAMLPFADPRDNELVRGQLVGTDAWALAGYAATARLLRAADRAREADEVDRARAAYVADFELALDATGRRDVPPSWSGAGRDWGNLAVTYPCGVLPADDPRVAATARRYWSRAGGAGIGWWGSPDSLHGYVGADLGTWALLAGRREAADSVLAALEHWRNASGGACELFSSAGEYGVNLPPHPTTAAALLTLARNALVYDEDDTLLLTLGARDAWWRGSRAEGLPTRWGTLDLRFRLADGIAEWAWTPVPVWTRLTLPRGARLAGPLPHYARAGGAPGTVLVPPNVGLLRVPVRGAGGLLAGS